MLNSGVLQGFGEEREPFRCMEEFSIVEDTETDNPNNKNVAPIKKLKTKRKNGKIVLLEKDNQKPDLTKKGIQAGPSQKTSFKDFGKAVFRLFYTKKAPPESYLRMNSLRNIKSGQFLVRRVQTYTGLEYILSVEKDWKVHNVPRQLYWLDSHAFQTIQQLVKFYMKSKMTFRVYDPELREKDDEERHQLNMADIKGKNGRYQLDFRLTTLIPRFRWQINHEQIELTTMLGSGQFREVHKGFLEVSFSAGRYPVAVKTLKGETLTTQEIYDILREADNMKELEHRNVVKFYGIAASREPIMIALEFCPGGALDVRLERTVYFIRLPYLNQYMAPEAIEKKISIKANDSWAFSVLIFEVFHRGFGPYHEYDPEDKVVDLLKKDKLHMYLFDRPKDETLPPGITANIRKWSLSLDKPDRPQNQAQMEILFKQMRFRYVKYRMACDPLFKVRQDISEESPKKILEDMMTKYGIED